MNPTRLLRPTPAGLAEAAAILRRGGLVAFPTETVYGLGADALDGKAVAGIYAAKGRPSFNPLIAHCPDLQAARSFGRFDSRSEALARHFWPGPLTLVVPAAIGSPVSGLVTAGLDSIGLRVPDHAAAQALLRAVGRPLAAPSANRSGRVSPTTATHVLEDLDGRIDAVLDGGETSVGLESTIVACLEGPAVLLRPGGVPRADIESVLGEPLAEPPGSAGDAPLAPGMLASHYAPSARVRLDVDAIAPDEAALLFGPRPPAGIERARATLNLSPSGDLVEAASNLFGMMRRLDASGAATIAVAPIPADGLGEAIRDRLSRAAAPRS